MDENSHNNNSFQWDQYWAYANINSLSSASTGNYAGTVAQFWKNQFGGLKHAAKILDIGTGNGAVAFFAAEVGIKKGLDFQIKAVDLAKIDPTSATKPHPELALLLPYIDFQGRVSANDLPFDSDYFDLIVGQYALEYTPLDSTLEELQRVLKPAGHLSFIMHHTDSIIMQTTADELEQARLIFDEANLFLHARELVEAIGDAKTPAEIDRLTEDKNANDKRHNLNDAYEYLLRKADTRKNSMFLRTALNYIAELFKAQALPLHEKLQYLQLCQQLIEGNRERIRDMCAAAFDVSRTLELSELCVTKGFTRPRISPFLNESKQLVGWKLLI